MSKLGYLCCVQRHLELLESNTCLLSRPFAKWTQIDSRQISQFSLTSHDNGWRNVRYGTGLLSKLYKQLVSWQNTAFIQIHKNTLLFFNFLDLITNQVIFQRRSKGFVNDAELLLSCFQFPSEVWVSVTWSEQVLNRSFHPNIQSRLDVSKIYQANYCRVHEHSSRSLTGRLWTGPFFSWKQWRFIQWTTLHRYDTRLQRLVLFSEHKRTAWDCESVRTRRIANRRRPIIALRRTFGGSTAKHLLEVMSFQELIASSTGQNDRGVLKTAKDWDTREECILASAGARSYLHARWI